jgi:hypothetical protein
VLTPDLAWLNPNLQKALAQQVWQASAHRLRGLPAPQRYTVVVCFLFLSGFATLTLQTVLWLMALPPSFYRR